MGRFSGQSHAEVLLLAVLSTGPKAGHAIATHLAEHGEPVVATDLYLHLHDLERRGHVAGAWGTTHGRRRRTYQLTDEGRSALDQARRAWADYSAAVDRIVGGRQWATTP